MAGQRRTCEAAIREEHQTLQSSGARGGSRPSRQNEMHDEYNATVVYWFAAAAKQICTYIHLQKNIVYKYKEFLAKLLKKGYTMHMAQED